MRFSRRPCLSLGRSIQRWWRDDSGEAVENVTVVFLVLGLGVAFIAVAQTFQDLGGAVLRSIPGVSIGE